MTAPKGSEFPELRRVFAGYLHEDFAEEHGSAKAALRAFLHDASAAERQRFRDEARRFVDSVDQLSLRELRTVLASLGCRWSPPSRRAFVELLLEVAENG